MQEPRAASAPPWPRGHGPAAAAARAVDWAATPLGPVAGWPAALRSTAALAMDSPVAMLILWGPALVQLHNDAYAALCGPGCPGGMGESLAKLIDSEPCLARFRQVLAGERLQFEAELGDQVLDFACSPLRDEDDTAVVGLFAVVARATEARRQAGLAARSEERLQLALDAGAIAGTWFWDVVPDRFTADVRFARSFGMDPAPLATGVPLMAVVQSIHPDDEDRVRGLILEALGRGGAYRAEYRVFRPGQGYGWVEANGRVDLDETGRALRFPGVLVDIDRRKRGELRQAALLALGDRMRPLLRAADVVAAATDTIGSTLATSRAGYGWVDAVSRTVEMFPNWTAAAHIQSVHGLHRFADFGSFIEDLLAGRSVAIADVREDPRTRDFASAFDSLGIRALLNVPLLNRGQLECVVFAHGIAPREWSVDDVDFARAAADRAWAALATANAVAELRTLNTRLETEVAQRAEDRDRLWRLSRDLMLVGNFEGRIEAVNPAWEATLGWREDELLDSHIFDLVHPDDLPITQQGLDSLSGGQASLHLENRYRHKDGSYRWISWTAGTGSGVTVGIGRDVTDDKAREASLSRAEAQLRQAQKMEAVGQLTGGLAHDFNNLLSSISVSLELMKRRAGQAEPEEFARHIAMAMKGVRGAASLTHRLLAFSRKQSLDARPIDVDKLVLGMEELLRRTLGERMSVSAQLGAQGWMAQADASQLESALMNLALNARDAMPDGGDLIILTEQVSIGQAGAAGADLKPGDYLAISVTDTGTGMPPEVLARAFDPFFTTKGIGKGSGLGLSMIHGFAKQSGGDATLFSQPGRGTTVKVLLPRALGADAPDSPRLPNPSALPALGRGQAVLLVEDEPDVRNATAEALLRMGYAPQVAHDAPTALAVLAGPLEIALMISDVGLPGLDGRELAARARELRPALKILFVTGYAAKAESRSEWLIAGADMLPKPFALDDLARRVARLLQAED